VAGAESVIKAQRKRADTRKRCLTLGGEAVAARGSENVGARAPAFASIGRRARGQMTGPSNTCLWGRGIPPMFGRATRPARSGMGLPPNIRRRLLKRSSGMDFATVAVFLRHLFEVELQRL
jgi:hypothetical protein